VPTPTKTWHELKVVINGNAVVPVVTGSELVRTRPLVPSTAGWICNAYGRDARHWLTVTGNRKPTKIDAEKSAMWECSRKLAFCSLSGCWHE
jgi:hypothetical protein